MVAPALLFMPFFFGRIVGNRDWPRWAWPSRALWRTAVLDGVLPQWNPFVGLGAPVLAAPVHGTFYPGHALLLVGPPVFAMALTWLVHTIIAGLGGLAVARKLGCRPAVALAAGLSWQIGGYAVSMWGNGEKVLSGAWVPWAAYGLLVLVDTKRWARPLCGTALAFALVALAGDPFLWLHAFLLGAAVAIGAEAEKSGLRRATLKFLARATLALALAALIAAVALVPPFYLLGGTERAGGLSKALAEQWSFAPSRIWDLLRPRALPDGSDVWALSVYVGGATLGMALWARRSALAASLWLAALLGLLAALGSHAPVHAALRGLIPPLRYLRYPEKHLLVCVGALSWLAALGAERLLAAGPTQGRLHLRDLVFALPPFLLLLAGTSVPELGHVGLSTAAAVLVLFLWRHHGSTFPRLVWTWPAVVGLDLLLAAMPVLHWQDAHLLEEPATLPIHADAASPPPRLYHAPAVGGELSTLVDNLAAPWGVAYVPGHETAQPAQTHRLWDSLTANADRAIDWFDIDWLVLPKSAVARGAVAVTDLGEAALFHRPGSTRIRVLGTAHVTDDAHALAQMGTIDPASIAIVAPGLAAHELAGQGRGTCAFVSATRESQHLTCKIDDGEALVVLADAYAPGWHATVDGQPVPIVRADVAMRGVYLAAGLHDLALRFRTPGLSLGITLSVLGLLACVLLTFACGRAEKSTRPG